MGVRSDETSRSFGRTQTGSRRVATKLRRISVGTSGLVLVGSFLILQATPASASTISNVTTPVISTSTAAGANASYSFSFTTSSTGGLSGQSGSYVALTLPSGMSEQGSETVFDGATQVNGGCGGGGSPYCTINTAVDPGTTLTYSFNAINPPAGTYTLGVSTSSDTTMVSSPSFTVTPAQAISNVTAPVISTSTAAGANASYTFSFTTSAKGCLSGQSGSYVALTLPSGMSEQGSGDGLRWRHPGERWMWWRGIPLLHHQHRGGPGHHTDV